MAEALPSVEVPELDLDALREEIRQEVAALRSSGQRIYPREISSGAPVATTRSQSFDLGSVRTAISLANSFADVGLQIPPMQSFRGVTRRLARLTAKLVLTLSRFITDRQRNFNHSTIQSLNILSDGVERTASGFARELALAFEQVRALQELAGRQADRITALEAILGERTSLAFPHRLDDRTCHALAAAFRLTSDQLLEGFQVYLPWIKRAGAGLAGSPVLDVGCGRGEWLSLLTEAGLEARGVDVNPLFVEECRSRNLEVALGEAVSYLRGVADGSLGAVTAFHVIEHLEFGEVACCLAEARRALRPGGVLILETPNPENILVGSCQFYVDPTHRKPVPAVLLRFLVEQAGFQGVETLKIHPFPERFRWTGSVLAEQLSEHFFGAQDYAIAGFR